MLELIKPNWPAPLAVKAYTTTRQGGFSQPPYDEFNLADHVGDSPEAVAANRSALVQTLALPSDPLWLKQIHGIQTIEAYCHHQGCSADAIYTTELGAVCVVLTADCLPVLFCDQAATCVAAVHAGWRGLANGILETVLGHLDVSPENLLVWFGPAIGPQAFEVSHDVRETFISTWPQAVEAFQPSSNKDHWLANLYLIAHQHLVQQGVTAIYGGDFCTYTETDRFYSYRRDQITGRMASLIWLAE